ncbi:MAG TPA: lysophospholipid acyltransferase family protein [Desulforhopalus sp.]|nr:lysophospholipid acyltransferase family protein [Desulforhopalus sp.]
MKEGRLNRFLLWLAPPVLAWVMRCWFFTCRVRIHDARYLFPPDQPGRQAIASFWHYSIFFIFYFLRRYRAIAMVSASRDGDYIARLAGQFGFATARGSRNQRGTEAFREMLKGVRSGVNGAIVVDGSQGPPRIAQSGAVLLAARSGVPIIPLAWSASRYFAIRSWDRTAIPRPFSRVEIFFGEPLPVPKQLSTEHVEEYRQLLESRLNQLYHAAWRLQGREEH